MHKHSHLSLSWVVPSLGITPQLNDLIGIACLFAISNNILIEFILVLPPCSSFYKYFDITTNEYFQLRCLRSPIKGQTFQRFFGIRQAKHCTIILSDDDISISSETLYNVIQSKITLGENSSIGLPIRDFTPTSRELIYPDIVLSYYPFSCQLRKFLLGTNSIGLGEQTDICIGTSFVNIKESPYNVFWLPGAFSIHTKQSLLSIPQYKWANKAYGEDYFHSFFLSEMGLKLYILKDPLPVVLTFSSNVPITQRFRTFIRYYSRSIQISLYLKGPVSVVKVSIYFTLLFFRMLYCYIIKAL